MKRVMITICLMLIVGSTGCGDDEQVKTKDLTPDFNRQTGKESEPVFDLKKRKGTPQQKLEQLKAAAKKGSQWIVEIRKPAAHALENIRINELLSMPGIPAQYIRVGPGMEYDDDDTGELLETELLYVLEEKDGWIRFRITQANLGWSAWIRKDFTRKY